MSVTPTAFPLARRGGSRRLFVMTPLLLVVAGMGVVGAKARVPDNEIAPGVQVGRLKLGGKTLEEARAAVQQWADERATITLNLGFDADTGITKTWTAEAHKLGLGLDVAATMDMVSKAGREGLLGQVSTLLTGAKTTRIGAKTTVDPVQLRACLKQIAYKVNRKPRNARLKLNSDLDIGDYIHDKPGLSVDIDGSITAVTQAWERFNGATSAANTPVETPAADKDTTTPPADPNAHQKPDSDEKTSTAPEKPAQPPTPDTSHTPAEATTLDVDLIAKATTAAITYDDVKQVDGLLGKMSTDVGGTANRHQNVALAASRINGTLLRPGEIFSYNKTVGPRSLEAGFKKAPEIVKGVLKDGIGGGVCQVSSTLFNSVLLSGLKIVDRSHHAFPVHYLLPGRDATVVDGDIDFKFQNDKESPVYIYGVSHNGTLSFRIYGKRVQGQEISLVQLKKSVSGYGSETQTDSSLPTGHREVKVPGHPKIDVTWARVFKQDGQVVKQEPFSTHYRAIPSVVIVGTGTPRGAKPKTPGTPLPATATKPIAPDAIADPTPNQ